MVVAGVVVLGAIMSILDITVVAVAQRTFQETFDKTQAQVAWTATAYTLALAMVIPLTGWAADRFGTKRLYILAIALFTAGSALCCDRHQPRDAGGLPGPAGPRWRHADAARHDDPDPRRRAGAARPGDGDPRRPDAARPDLRPDPRWLADRHRLVALDLPDQRPDRHRRGDLRLVRARSRRGPPVGELRLRGHAAAVARTRSVPVRRELDPGREAGARHHVHRQGRLSDDRRAPAGRRVHPVGAPQAQHPPAGPAAAVHQPLHDRRRDHDDPVRDGVLRGLAAVHPLLPAGARRDAARAPAGWWPRRASARW